MKVTELPIAALRLQYEIARYPLQLIEEQVITRFDSEAPLRLFYERSLGRLDTTVGDVLGVPEFKERGEALIERSEALARAAALDAAADQRLQRAGAELKEARAEAIDEQKAAHAEKEQDVKSARKTALQRKNEVTETVQRRSTAVKRNADEVAAQRTKAAEATKNRQTAEIREAEREAVAEGTAKLENAADKRETAAAKQVRAENLDELADVEKSKRQQEAADNS